MLVAVTAPQSPLGVDRAWGRIAVCCDAPVAMVQGGYPAPPFSDWFTARRDAGPRRPQAV